MLISITFQCKRDTYIVKGVLRHGVILDVQISLRLLQLLKQLTQVDGACLQFILHQVVMLLLLR